MMTKKKTMLSLITNLLIFVITVCVVISYFFAEPNVLIQHGVDAFRFFTTDSNILVAIASITVAIADIRILLGKTESLPKAILLFKFVGTACVTLTMTATVGFLMPVYGTFVMQGSLIIVHAITPLLALLSFVFLENVYCISIPQSLIGTIPMMIYGLVYAFMVTHHIWDDFYRYNRGGQWLLSAIFMTSGCFVMAIITALLHNLALRNKKDST
ncbi:MAG: hypothetical protein IJU14_03360 [Clostridia bacterium]|nr:hypothetical protein [Clostridia bacterium]